nr:MAG TPA: hypothetical protein [Caudoviricetes sp.]
MYNLYSLPPLQVRLNLYSSYTFFLQLWGCALLVSFYVPIIQ